jgi:hypothetical protein
MRVLFFEAAATKDESCSKKRNFDSKKRTRGLGMKRKKKTLWDTKCFCTLISCLEQEKKERERYVREKLPRNALFLQFGA